MLDNLTVQPHYLNMGTGPNKKLVLVSVCSISICYRGLDPPNRNVTMKERKSEREMGHAKCGINFPPATAVGSPVMAVWDTMPGRTNSIEEIVIY